MESKNNYFKIILIGITILLLIAIVLLILSQVIANGDSFISNNKKVEIIKSKIGIDIPNASNIVNFTYDEESGSFEAKIYIEEKDINLIKNELNKYFKYEITEPYDMWHFENTCSWWDLKKNDVKMTYRTYVIESEDTIENLTYSHDVWAFIASDEQGKYYLYIAY
ncbi:hypothetical protein EHE19_011870 [Ruminiclostridium herbifermentans]|uniref:Uncharacterized protein n=1 Tax=Ruminiclostridium herbifermentans TaxID=2488810 RepID=A0A4U7JAJ2_9FIRM|nr:hypothetical protein [Ruminiclostridium herbifermentans]QNU65619.1 hypothetical protein EHE19_011870 [Ruminiclostridium herbifermentans]